MTRLSVWRRIALLLLLGCGSEPDNQIFDTYTLVGVEGSPLPYLERASERIFQLEKTLFEAVEAATPRLSPGLSSEMISASKAEYDGFLACLAIIENGLARLVADAEDPQSA